MDESLYYETVKKYDEGDFTAAFVVFSQFAQRGHADAQNYLGIMYGAGLGVEADQRKSLLYHKRAVRKAKDTIYLSNLARQYEVMGNRRRALYWLHRASATGDKSAALELAKCCCNLRVAIRENAPLHCCKARLRELLALRLVRTIKSKRRNCWMA